MNLDLKEFMVTVLENVLYFNSYCQDNHRHQEGWVSLLSLIFRIQLCLYLLDRHEELLLMVIIKWQLIYVAKDWPVSEVYYETNKPRYLFRLYFCESSFDVIFDKGRFRIIKCQVGFLDLERKSESARRSILSQGSIILRLIVMDLIVDQVVGSHMGNYLLGEVLVEIVHIINDIFYSHLNRFLKLVKVLFFVIKMS